MNDFTKDDLEFMHKWLNWITEENYPLKNKIQSMIESCCEERTADVKEFQAICSFNENGNSYFTIESDLFADGAQAGLDMAYKIICGLVIGDNHFDNEWIDKIMMRLEELRINE